MNKFLFVFAISCLFIISCEKEKDEEAPLISLESPRENESFQVLSSFSVKGTVSDNEIIERIGIFVYSSQSQNLALSPIFLFPQSSTYTIDQRLVISDSLLESGPYYLKVTAYDGEQEQSVIRNMTIGGISKRRLELVYAQELSGGGTEIIALNTAGNQRQLLSLNSSCQELLINSYDQMLWYASNTNHLLAYQLVTETTRFDQFMPNNGFSPLFRDMKLFDRKVFLSTRAGELKAYNNNASDVFTYQSPSGFFPNTILPGENYVLAEERSSAGNPTGVVSLFQASGAKAASTLIADNLLAFGFLSDEKAQFVLQQNSTIQLFEFDPSLGLTNLIYSRAIVPFDEGIAISENSWLFYGSSGLYYFNQQSQFVKQISARTDISALCFDALNQEAILAAGTTILSYSIPSGVLLSSHTASSKVSGIAIRYNR